MAKKIKSIDATSSQKWNIYQYVLVIEKLLTSKDGEIIYIEKFWDLSDSDTSIESKHHENELTLWDKHKDLWKTIYNWLMLYDTFINYKNLIFYTTAKLPKDSNLVNWNTSTSKEKYETLNNIIASWIVNDVSKYMNYFLSYDKEKIEEILQKVIISTENDNLDNKIENLIKTESIFGSVKNKSNRKKLFDDMMWIFLWFYIDKNDISKNDFFEDLRPKLYSYFEYEYVLDKPNNLKTINKNYKDEKFINELIQIKIPENSRNIDIRDYAYTNNNLLNMVKHSWLLCELNNFESLLIDKLNTIKDEHSISEDSFKVYFDTKKSNIIINNYFENNNHFQNWFIHNCVNDSKFTWLYK